MAHNINYNSETGKYSFFSVKEKAWHGLGQIVEQYPTSSEAIRHAGLDYEVAKSPLYTKASGIIQTSGGIEMGSTELAVPDCFATIRTARVNEMVNCIYLVNNRLWAKKNGTKDDIFLLSRVVTSTGFKPVTS